MNPIKQLQEKRGSLITQAEAILKPARDESRSLTSDEAASYDAISKEINDVDVSLEREIRQLELNGNRNHATLSRNEQRDVQRFSITRGIASLLSGRPLEGIEAEMHQEGLKEARSSGVATEGNFVIPMIALSAERRDMTATLGSNGDQGGVTVATETGSIISLLYAKSVLRNLGARYLTGLVGNITFPRMVAGTAGYHVAENTAPTESSPTMNSVSLTPNRLATYVEISKQLILQGNESVEAMVREDLATALNLGMENGALNGTGLSNQPLGILAATSGADFTSVVGGSDGLAPTWANIVGLETAVSNLNADVGSLGYLTNTKVRGKLKSTLVTATYGDKMIWSGGPTPLNEYRAEVTTQVPSTLDKGNSTGVCSAIIFANWSDLVIGMWGGIDIMANPYIKDIEGLVRINAAVFYDTVIRRGASFAAMKDALTA